MTRIEIQKKIHSNTRGTRITFHGSIGSKEVALKCYRRPLWGLFHTVRALIRGSRIRRRKAPFPDIVFWGWVPQERCFGYATGFLSGYESVRYRLIHADESGQSRVIGCLGRLIAELHIAGLEQTDGNLTNFLMDASHNLAVVDEDDVKIHSRSLRATKAIRNLSNVAARLPSEAMREEFLNAYLSDSRHSEITDNDIEEFWLQSGNVRLQLDSKRSARNIASRKFD